MDETLATLEGYDLGEPGYDSHLVTTCHRLWKTPLSQFSVEDYRIMIGQGLGLTHLMPRALALLADDPLAEGDYYPGDPLHSVLQAEEWFWEQQPQLLSKAIAIAEAGIAKMNSDFEEGEEDILQNIVRALDALREQYRRQGDKV